MNLTPPKVQGGGSGSGALTAPGSGNTLVPHRGYERFGGIVSRNGYPAISPSALQIRRAAITICAAIVASLAYATAAQAAESSFAGQCTDIRGTATVDKPLTFTASQNAGHFSSAGHCNGKLNGEDVTNAPIESHADGPFYGSCYGTRSTSPGPDVIRFTRGTPDQADDVVIRGTLTWSSDTVNGTYYSVKGEKSGQGGGYSDPPPDSWAALYKACLADGARSLPFNATFYTGSDPIVSETPRVTRLAIHPRTLTATSRGELDATVEYSLSAGGVVRFAVARVVYGRRVEGQCIRRARANRGSPSCVLSVTPVGAFSRRGSEGRNSFEWNGRVVGKPLEIGSYRLVATPAGAGQAGSARASFRVK